MRAAPVELRMKREALEPRSFPIDCTFTPHVEPLMSRYSVTVLPS
jgi:hypothetical protein